MKTKKVLVTTEMVTILKYVVEAPIDATEEEISELFFEGECEEYTDCTSKTSEDIVHYEDMK